MDIEKLKISIEADISKLMSGLNTAKNEMKNFSNSFKSSFNINTNSSSFNGLQNGINNVNKQTKNFSNNLKAINTGITGLGTTAQSSMAGIGTAGLGAVNGINTLGTDTTAVMGQIKTNSGVASTGITGIGTAGTESISGVTSLGEAGISAFNGISSSAGVASNGVCSVAKAIQGLKNQLQGISLKLDLSNTYQGINTLQRKISKIQANIADIKANNSTFKIGEGYKLPKTSDENYNELKKQTSNLKKYEEELQYVRALNTDLNTTTLSSDDESMRDVTYAYNKVQRTKDNIKDLKDNGKILKYNQQKSNFESQVSFLENGALKNIQTQINRINNVSGESFTNMRRQAQQTGTQIRNSFSNVPTNIIDLTNLNNMNGPLVQAQANVKRFGTQAEKAAKQGQKIGDNTSKGLKKAKSHMNGFIGSIKSMIKAMLPFMTLMAAIKFLKDSVEEGSNLAEVQNVVDSTFTNMSGQVDNFAKNASASFGLSETMAKKFTGTFGAMSKSFGFSEKQALDMSTTLTGLAGDVASFYNITQDEAYTKLKSVFTGETESLKELGVVMTQNALDQYAMANGYGKTTNKMTEQEKVALRYAFVQDKLKTATGDFSRTQDSWANQTRLLKLNFQSLKAEIGQGLITVLVKLVKGINFVMTKVIQLATAFKQLMQSIFGVTIGSGAGGGMAETGEALANATSNTDNLNNSLDTTAEKAKKATDRLMGFDEINKINQDNDDTSTSSIPSNLDSNLDFSQPKKDLNEMSGIIHNILNIAGKIKDKFLELIDLFKSGFKIGIGDDFFDSLDRIKDHIKNIGFNIIDIFSDSDVQAAANELMNKLAFNLGKVVGSIASVGASIAECLIGGIDKWLEEYKDKIKGWLVRTMNITGEIADLIGNFSVAIADIFEVLRSDTAKQIVANILGGISDAIMGASELFMKIGRDILNLITKPIIDNKDKIKEALENNLKSIETITGTVKQYLSDTWSKINEVYDNTVKPAFDKLTSGVSDTFSKALDAYNTYIAPIINSLANDINAVYEEHIKPVIDNVVELVGEFINCMVDWYLNNLKPCIDFIYTSIIPAIAPVISYIKDVVILVITNIIDVIGGIIRSLKGVIQFLDGVFTGDWNKAWEGIKNTFGGIWDAIKAIPVNSFNFVKGKISSFGEWVGNKFAAIRDSVVDKFKGIGNCIGNFVSSGFKYIVNGAIYKVESFVNSFIKKVNGVLGLINEIPGVNISPMNEINIPKLARGGVVNGPTTALIGEAGQEAVVPLENNTDWIDKIANKISSSICGGSDNGQPVTINIKLREETIASCVIDNINKMAKMNGYSPILI